METTKEILISIGIIFIVLYVVANKLENGDSNAISMFFVVFFIPLIMISIINGIWLSRIKRLKIEIRKIRILSFIPVLIVSVLIYVERISIIDGSLKVIGIVGAIGIGISNLIWNFKLRN